ncbi:hypothetical protein G0D98_23030 [Pseudomonas savastanoi pv. phaseolicola]|uniref:hypothetical protein n=1 Tax=Pseudomonas savastanoi TaxID=29438 RepID=UPI0011C47DFC|nr:hypothetical protein [Pseudomonas savastanoi]MBN3471298.1 hypothetical protein [Pseudomonas savastanoi pv. phaseolicola]MBN3478315.1 hypothetical protein [Pseudomonas savastanoi pv. phaseolicola]
MSLADDLLLLEGEHRARAAIGRSYYALFHEALSAADSMSLAPPSSERRLSTHEYLIQRFVERGKGLARIGRGIRKQKLMRAAADYDIADDITLEEAALHIHISKSLISDLQRLSSEAKVS